MRIFVTVLMSVSVLATGALADDGILARITKAPESGLVVAHVDLTSALPKKTAAGGTLGVTALAGPDKVAVPAQFVPDEDFTLQKHAVGTLVLKLPKGGDWAVKLEAVPEPLDAKDLTGPITTAAFTVEFGKPGTAPFPTKIVFSKTKKVFDKFAWNDRVYDNEFHEAFSLRYDKKSTARVISAGKLCTVIRSRARYCKPDGSTHPANPAAVYDWYIFNDSGLMLVSALIRQESDFIWDELHFLELNYPDAAFTAWAGGQPAQKGVFTQSKKSFIFPNWGAIIDGQSAIGMLGGKTTIYDGRGEYGTYLHSRWELFRDRERRLATWLWVGCADDPAQAVSIATTAYKGGTKAMVLPRGFDLFMEERKKYAATLKPVKKQQALWNAALIEKMVSEGLAREAGELTDDNKCPAHMRQFTSGEMGVAIRVLPHGVQLESLFDLKTSRELTSDKSRPLFEIALQKKSSKEKAQLTSEDGWGDIGWWGSKEIQFRFASPLDERLKGLLVTLTATPQTLNSLAWKISVEDKNAEWALSEVRFPQVSLTKLGDKTTVLFPRGPGALAADLWNQVFSYDGRYPSGWCSMPLLAVYDTTAGTGLYFAVHDDKGSTKDLIAESDPGSESIRLAFSEPVPDMGVTPNTYQSGGVAVWRLLRGDWFDAALVYKAWAREHARWWPKLGKDGREDTPLWMRELCAWANTGGAPAECVQSVKEFQQFLGVPVGFHWYRWHQIPFDNDYPHYFPAKDGFAAAVKDLQRNNVYVMPYINGRLWDTRDKGMEDFEFTKIALPAVTKGSDGKPITETYGSKEADGSPVKLGVMCPTTPLWQKTVKDIVLRLQNECGTKGVYIDQIAAAAPVLCMDKSHGHPLGGGHWWNEGYWELLDGIRKDMQPDRMITTECNAEPFIRWLDGYLTWHWQYDAQVPVFPAIYGGTVQMFGRAYDGGATKDLALRMRVAQQLVFGEQIGWLDPKMLAESESKDFFRQAVRVRHNFRRYFYAGEMGRPPQLNGLPEVKADWQWGGEMWVTTDAVLTGAWRLPAEKKLVLLFANVSDAPVTSDFAFHGNTYDMNSPVNVQAFDGETTSEQFKESKDFNRTITVAPRKVVAWEITTGA